MSLNEAHYFFSGAGAAEGAAAGAAAAAGALSALGMPHFAGLAATAFAQSGLSLASFERKQRARAPPLLSIPAQSDLMSALQALPIFIAAGAAVEAAGAAGAAAGGVVAAGVGSAKAGTTSASVAPTAKRHDLMVICVFRIDDQLT